MKKFVISILLGLTVSHQSFAGLQNFTNKSVIFLFQANEIGLKKKNLLKENIYPEFVKLKQGSFKENQMFFMLKNVTFAMSLVAIFADREIAPYDLMVRIDLNESLTDIQIEELRKLKIKLAEHSSEVTVFLTENTQFHKANDAQDSDIAMAFINRWHPDLTKDQAQKYWIEHHGPLVIKTGLPPVIKSYTQVHNDIKVPENDLFDHKYQGLSFETISSQSKFILYFLKNPSVRKLNEVLLEDEKNFTAPPLFFVFKTIKIN